MIMNKVLEKLKPEKEQIQKMTELRVTFCPFGFVRLRKKVVRRKRFKDSDGV